MNTIKNNKYFFLIFFLSLLPIILILANPLQIHTHDGPVHLARMAAWFKALKDGQIPPRWAADLNYGFGTPVLIFMYPWPYFLSSIFLGLGFGLVSSFKLVLSLSFLISGIFFFLFAQEFFKNKLKAFLATVFYQFASFRLVEIVVRGALGEVWSYAFLPLALLGLTKIFQGNRRSGFILASLGAVLLILSHNSVSLVFFATLVLFAFIFKRHWFDFFWSLIFLAFGLALSSFYWLPALWERRFTYGDLFMKNLYLEHFPTLKQLFLPNLLNKPWGWVNDIPVQIGLLPLLGLVFIRKKKLLIFSWAIFLFSFFFMQWVSIPFWQKFAILRQFQFSWRLLSLIVLATALTSVVFFKKAKLAIFLVLLLSLPYWRPPVGFEKVDENYFWNYPLNTTYFGEANTIWAANPPEAYPDQRVKIISGKAEIKNFTKNSTRQSFTVSAKTEVNVLSNTIFFPGWRAFADGQQVPIEFQDQNYRGLITFRLSAGEHQVQIKFGHTKDRTAAETVSLLSWVFLLTIVYYKNILNFIR